MTLPSKNQLIISTVHCSGHQARVEQNLQEELLYSAEFPLSLRNSFLIFLLLFSAFSVCIQA